MTKRVLSLFVALTMVLSVCVMSIPAVSAEGAVELNIVDVATLAADDVAISDGFDKHGEAGTYLTTTDGGYTVTYDEATGKGVVIAADPNDASNPVAKWTAGTGAAATVDLSYAVDKTKPMIISGRYLREGAVVYEASYNSKYKYTGGAAPDLYLKTGSKDIYRAMGNHDWNPGKLTYPAKGGWATPTAHVVPGEWVTYTLGIIPDDTGYAISFGNSGGLLENGKLGSYAANPLIGFISVYEEVSSATTSGKSFAMGDDFKVTYPAQTTDETLYFDDFSIVYPTNFIMTADPAFDVAGNTINLKLNHQMNASTFTAANVSVYEYDKATKTAGTQLTVSNAKCEVNATTATITVAETLVDTTAYVVHFTDAVKDVVGNSVASDVVINGVEPLTAVEIASEGSLTQIYGETTEVTFTGAPTPADGNAAGIKWYVNGEAQDTNGTTFKFTPVFEGAYVVKAGYGSTVFSNEITINVGANASIAPIEAISIVADNDATQVCGSTTAVNFTATTTPATGIVEESVVWYVNNVLQDDSNGLSFAYTPVEAGTYTVKAVNVENEEVVSNEITITVNKADPEVTWPTVKAVTEGKPFINALNNDGEGAGIFTIQDATVLAKMADNGLDKIITFTPNDTENYNVLTKSVAITVTEFVRAVDEELFSDDMDPANYNITEGTITSTNLKKYSMWSVEANTLVKSVADPKDGTNYVWQYAYNGDGAATTANSVTVRVPAALFTETVCMTGRFMLPEASGSTNSFTIGNRSVSNVLVFTPGAQTVKGADNVSYKYTPGEWLEYKVSITPLDAEIEGVYGNKFIAEYSVTGKLGTGNNEPTGDVITVTGSHEYTLASNHANTTQQGQNSYFNLVYSFKPANPVSIYLDDFRTYKPATIAAEPTPVPTVAPTTAPTAEPTTEPTTEPTAEPTAEPTVAPTATPAVVDTVVLDDTFSVGEGEYSELNSFIRNDKVQNNPYGYASTGGYNDTTASGLKIAVDPMDANNTVAKWENGTITANDTWWRELRFNMGELTESPFVISGRFMIEDGVKSNVAISATHAGNSFLLANSPSAASNAQRIKIGNSSWVGYYKTGEWVNFIIEVVPSADQTTSTVHAFLSGAVAKSLANANEGTYTTLYTTSSTNLRTTAEFISFAKYLYADETGAAYFDDLKITKSSALTASMTNTVNYSGGYHVINVNHPVVSSTVAAENVHIYEYNPEYDIKGSPVKVTGVWAPSGVNTFTVMSDDLSADKCYIMTFDAALVDGLGYSITEPIVINSNGTPSKVYSVKVTTEGSGTITYNGTDNWSSSRTEYYAQGESFTLTAVPADDSVTFVGWLNEKTNKLISSSADYNVTVGSNAILKAVFRDSGAEDYHVMFKNMNAQVLERAYVNKTNTITVPQNPYIKGYKFLSWITDAVNAPDVAPGKVLTVDDFKCDTTFVADYEGDGKTYTITVEGGTLEGGATEGSFKYNEKVVVNAGTAPDGQVFSHWTKGGATVGYDETYSFYAGETITVTAVYAEAKAEAVPVAMMLEPEVLSDVSKISFVAERIVPENYSLVEFGILLTDVDDAANFVFEGSNVKHSKQASTVNPNAQFTLRKANVNVGDTWYARAYLIYKDADGKVSVTYSDIVDATM